MFSDERLDRKYPTLSAVGNPLKAAEREIVGREHEMLQLMASMARPELCNALMLGPAGSGKTAVVQGVMKFDPKRIYLEADPARMISEAGDADKMAAMVKTFFDEAEAFVQNEGIEMVVFIDEFHQIVMLSDASVEAIKPVLAASGARGIRIIAATTNDEFHKYIAPNQPLVQRLQRIDLSPPDEDTTVKILEGMAERYGVADQFIDDQIYRLIYEYSERYQQSDAQPRKSILMLDSMCGWHATTKRPMNKDLLADVIKESTGNNIAMRVDGGSIKRKLDTKVLSQDLATTQVARRLQLVVADLHDKSKPLSSILLTGSTGVGKECSDTTAIPTYTADGSVAWKTHGDLVPGDQVFGRHGRPIEVLGHFPQGLRDIYRVTTSDGRSLDVGGPHLWTVYTAKQRSKKHAGTEVTPMTLSTLEILERGVVRSYAGDSREHLKFFIPMNEAVAWPEQDLAVDPYVLGALIGNGCLTSGPLTTSSDSEDAIDVVMYIGEWLGTVPKSSATNYNWTFPASVGRSDDSVRDRLHATKDVLASVPELIGTYSRDRRIPDAYKHGSIQQRWELIRGLFDTDGTIDATTGRFNVSYSTFSPGLAEDVREVLFSLGVSNSVKTWTRTKDDGGDSVEYDIHVKVGNADKAQFFSLERKRAIAASAVEATAGRERVKKFDMVGIKSIEKLDEQESASCIYVDDDEHLYQAGDFVVTHNTELTKQLAKLIHGDDQRHLIRFDMSEYASDETFLAFRSELTKKVWDLPFSILLFDEIEKAAAMVTRTLLQVLDDGRLSDDNGRTVSFLNTYIVLTTNAGSEIYQTIGQYAADDQGSGTIMEEYTKLIRRSISETSQDNRFPPELLGRIDAIVPFQPLSPNTQKKIIRTKLKSMVNEIRLKHNVDVTVHPRVLVYLAEDKVDDDSNAGGARAAVARLTTDVTTEIATFINEHPGERQLGVEIDGELISENKHRRTSEAKVVVSAIR